jgi:hypothetical protein
MFRTESRVVLLSEMFHCVIRTWSERHSRYSPCAIPPGSPVGFRWPSSSYGQLLIAPYIPASVPILAGGMVDGTYSNPRTTSEWPPLSEVQGVHTGPSPSRGSDAAERVCALRRLWKSNMTESRSIEMSPNAQ